LVNVGAAAPPDMNLGAIIATAFTILTGATPETALTIAIPIAVLGQLLGILLRTLLASLTHKADNLVEEGDFEAAQRIHIVWATTLYALSYFIPIFSAIYFGTTVIESLVGVIPEWLTTGLTVASKILPAYGFALLLNTMMTTKNVVFLLAGFFITAYSGISVTAISIFAVIVAFILADIKFNRPTISVAGAGTNDFEDFDDLDSPDDL
jgi:PTS system mannose-specific IIC component